MTDETLKHAKWINVHNRTEAKWESIEFFWTKFRSVSNLGDTEIKLNTLYDEFCEYQTMTDDDFGENTTVDGEEISHHRMDTCALVVHL